MFLSAKAMSSALPSTSLTPLITSIESLAQSQFLWGEPDMTKVFILKSSINNIAKILINF